MGRLELTHMWGEFLLSPYRVDGGGSSSRVVFGLLEKNIAAVAKRLSDVEAECNRETRGALPEIERNWYNLRAPESNG
jgi:hypothetical protein